MWEHPGARGRRLLPRIFPGKTPSSGRCKQSPSARARGGFASGCPTGSIDSAAVGEKKGTLYFDDSDPLGGHLSASPYNQNYKPCPVSSVDDLIQETNLPAHTF